MTEIVSKGLYTFIDEVFSAYNSSGTFHCSFFQLCCAPMKTNNPLIAQDSVKKLMYYR